MTGTMTKTKKYISASQNAKKNFRHDGGSVILTHYCNIILASTYQKGLFQLDKTDLHHELKKPNFSLLFICQCQTICRSAL